MKIKYIPAAGEKGKVRSATRKEMNIEVRRIGLRQFDVDMRDGTATVVLKDGSSYSAEGVSARDGRVLATGVFKAAEGNPNEAEDDASDI